MALLKNVKALPTALCSLVMKGGAEGGWAEQERAIYLLDEGPLSRVREPSAESGGKGEQGEVTLR